MTRSKPFFALLIVLLFVGACRDSSGIEPETSLTSRSANLVSTEVPPETQAVQTAATKEPATSAPTLTPTREMVPVPKNKSDPTDTPTAPTSAPVDSNPEEIVFGPGEVSAVRAGGISTEKEYRVYALEGQIMRVVVRSEDGDPALAVFSPAGEFLPSIFPWLPYWRGELPVSGEYRVVIIPETGPMDIELSVLILPPGETSWWTAYRDDEYGFALEYSDRFGIGYSSKVSGILDTTMVFSLIYLDNESFEGTNLREADLTINVGKNPEQLESCLEIPSYEQDLGETLLDGVPFSGSWYGDAGAGNFYEVRTYRAVHKDTCYEILFLIHFTGLGGYGSESNIKEFDRDVVLEDLLEVLHTFHFVP